MTVCFTCGSQNITKSYETTVVGQYRACRDCKHEWYVQDYADAGGRPVEKKDAAAVAKKIKIAKAHNIIPAQD